MMLEDTYLRAIKAIIANYGHAVQYVGGDPETGARPFAYTIGLHRSGGRDYELAVSGLGPAASAGVLDLLAEALSENDTPPSAGLQVRNLLELGLDLRLRLVSHPEELGVIRLVYGAAPTVWQALWPDLANRFPGDPAYDLADELQELL
ncbi:hypothetical protein GCM10022403_083700 [Streptomyces coacervatus]|uniref:DUF4262 domain-containing protein n=1 Tax=Streptomyces coacervatus TaxID=647381 RepID=A0ABP7J9J1_9ACTN|nr:DUF4262 domain-containing protein [Streptomyces coacervatus]MDF2270276.1 DUF4262 domain-containing protein [Streptomyces coacervatus]